MTNTNTRELHCDVHNDDTIFFVTGEVHAENDGGNDGETIYAATWERLHQVNPRVARLAKSHGLTECGFTTAYGDLIAIGAPGVISLDDTLAGHQCAVYANGTWQL